MKEHVLIDDMDTTGENRLHCSCGKRLYPDCDVSMASINRCFEEHLEEAS